MSHYIPGVCNINPREIAMRKKAMWVSAAVSVVVLATLLFFATPRFSRLVLFLPLVATIVSYLQVRNRFCVAYGMSGTHHADDTKNATVIHEEAARAADKKRSRSLYIQAVVLAVIVTALALVLP